MNEISTSFFADTAAAETRISGRMPKHRLVWLPVPLFLLTVLGLWLSGNSMTFSSPLLQLAIYLVFSMLASICAAMLFGQNFLGQGLPGMLFLGCGVILWGAAGFVAVSATVFRGRIDVIGVNHQVAIHNCCTWLAAVCHLAGAAYPLRWKVTLVSKRLWLAGAYLVTIVVVALVVLGVFSDWMPVFFIQGHGGTPVRQFVLGSAIVMFLLTAGLLKGANRPPSLFVQWYSLALLLLAIGLSAMLLATVHGSLLGWTARLAQSVAGVYLVVAAVTLLREQGIPIKNLDEALSDIRYRYSVSIAIVVAAAVVRLIFLQDLGYSAPYSTFYPAVMLAALYGGMPAGMVAIFLSALLADLFWISPAGQGHVLGTGLHLIVFLLSSISIAWITDMVHRAQIRTAELQARLLAASKQTENELLEDLVQMVIALQKSEERYALAIEATNDGIWDRDIATGKTFFSPRWMNMLGYDDKDIPESNVTFWKSLIHPEDYEATMTAMNAYLEGNAPEYELEYRLRHKDGSYRWILTRGACCRDSNGKPYRMAGSHTDITRRKLAEQALVQESARALRALDELRSKEQMLLYQSRQAAMGEMIGNIAHQWRQPLNTLGLLVQQAPLFYELGEADQDFLINNAKKAMEIILHMSKTIDDFRNYFQPDKERVDFRVDEVVARTLSLMEGCFTSQQITVTVRKEHDPIIHGFPNEFSQVLLNILTNARDALTERAILHPQITISFKCENERTVVTIADNAGGVADEIQEKIFEPYFTTKGPQYGTGVGLFMSKTIIEKNMGGSLSFSNKNGGAEFRIEV